MIALLEVLKLPMVALAPISGILMAGATASTTAGATIASQTFSSALVQSGVAPVSAAAMIHAGATVVDSLPHGSFFHATGGSVFMGVKERLKLIPYEAAVGLTATIVSCLCSLS
jgi:GntP family gluconate:H+ symporter